MPQPPLATPHEYWSNGFGTGVATTWEFEGREGVARLSGPASFSPTGQTRFHASLTRVQLDHIALETFVATPHRYERTAADAARDGNRYLSFLLLMEGTMHVELATGPFGLIAGEFVVVDSRDPMAYSALTDVRVLSTMVGIDHIPEFLRRRGTTLPGPLRRTPLTDSFIAFVSTVLRITAAGRHASGDHLVRAVAELQCGVLAESQQVTDFPPGPDGLRFRMEEHIETHYADPDLSPTTIAATLGISLRHAHNVFDHGDRTIARYIRDRRLRAVTLELRTAVGPIDHRDLAARCGFTGPDQMGRSFRNRFGVSIRDYRASGHRDPG